MTLDFAPRPIPASRSRQIWQHAKMESALILSNGEQLILGALFPLVMLIGGWLWGERFGLNFQQLAPSVLGVVMWSSGLTTLAISTGFERRYNVLERLAATPLGKTGMLLGKGLSIAMILLGQVMVLALLSLGLGWRPTVSPLAWLLTGVTCIVASLSFIGLGLAIAGSLQPETTLALSNLLFLLGIPLGLLIPVASFPGWAQPILCALPTAAVGESLRVGSAGHCVWLPLLVSMLWAFASVTLADKVFQWTS